MIQIPINTFSSDKMLRDIPSFNLKSLLAKGFPIDL